MTPAKGMHASRGGRSPVRFCYAKTRSGGKCKRGAGWGTDHPGTGHCKVHGGSTPNQRTKARRDQALEFAKDALGAELDVDPVQGILSAVRLSAGLVQFYRGRLAALEAADVDEALMRDYREAVRHLSQHSKAALDAGVAERLVRVAEGYAETITLAAEEALAALEAHLGISLDDAARTAYAHALGQGLTRHEGDSVPGTARELLT